MASKPTSTSGTTSSALKTDPQASATVGVPEKYRWWHVPMMPPDKKDRRRKQRRRRGHARPNQIQPHEQKGDDGRGEDFEKAFHPQVHDPPPPVLDHRQMRMLAPASGRPRRTTRWPRSRPPAARRVASAPPSSAAPAAARGSSGTTTSSSPTIKARSARRGPGRRIRIPDGRSRTTRRRTACCGCSATRRSASRRPPQAAPETAR